MHYDLLQVSPPPNIENISAIVLRLVFFLETYTQINIIITHECLPRVHFAAFIVRNKTTAAYSGTMHNFVLFLQFFFVL